MPRSPREQPSRETQEMAHRRLENPVSVSRRVENQALKRWLARRRPRRRHEAYCRRREEPSRFCPRAARRFASWRGPSGPSRLGTLVAQKSRRLLVAESAGLRGLVGQIFGPVASCFGQGLVL